MTVPTGEPRYTQREGNTVLAERDGGLPDSFALVSISLIAIHMYNKV